MTKKFCEIKAGELFKVGFHSPILLMKTDNEFEKLIPEMVGGGHYPEPTGNVIAKPGNAVVYSGDDRGELIHVNNETDYYIPEDQNVIVGGTA